MKVLGLVMVRNGESRVERALDSMALYCDDVYVLNNRSVDRTADILELHPAVTNVFSADATSSQEAWVFPESMCLDLLYRMADFCIPDWVVYVNDDETIEPAKEIRQVLASLDQEVSGVALSLVSVWNDSRYPRMVPLMSQAKSLQGRIWRYYRGSTAGTKPLHNSVLPSNIEDFGEIKKLNSPVVYHQGWDTLEKRINKVDLYTSLDPQYEHSFGVPYDQGLLFGYKREAINDLIRDYRLRFGEDKR